MIFGMTPRPKNFECVNCKHQQYTKEICRGCGCKEFEPLKHKEEKDITSNKNTLPSITLLSSEELVFIAEKRAATAEKLYFQRNNEKKEPTEKILDILDDVDDKKALLILAEVVSKYDLQVASNLIKNNIEPLFMTKGSLEEYFYSEGNNESGHLPLLGLLKQVEEIINLDDSEADIKFQDNIVRKYTDSELEEDGKTNDGIEWYKADEEKKAKDMLIGFETK